MHTKLKYFLIFLSFSLVINASLVGGHGMKYPDRLKDHSSKSISREVLNQESKIVNLITPGDYRLVGIDSIDKCVDSGDEDIIKIKKDNQIIIGESGEYNVTLENVNIDVSNINKGSAVTVEAHCGVNLTVVGENILRSNNGSAIDCERDSKLTITKESENGFLTLLSNKRGINARNLIIEAGNIEICGDECGIFGTEIIINKGNISTSSDTIGLMGSKILINGGNITSLGGKYGIWSTFCDLKSDDGCIEVNGGAIKVEGNMIGINAVNITVNRGKVNTIGKDMYGVYAKNIEIFNSKVNAKGCINGIYAKDMKINDSEIATSSNVAV